MTTFTVDQVREIMKNQNNIRNMSVIAHVDHGKSTLTDSLVKRAGITSSETKCFTHFKKDEQERGITIKSTGLSLYYEYDAKFDGKPEKYLINLIDSPGHVDFSSEVTAALRVTDGALVVVDYIEGVCVQTETVLRQALMELIKPIVMINKVDRAFFEVNHDPETIYQNFDNVIGNVNKIIATYEKHNIMGDCQVYPTDNNVAFGSAKQGWGFTLNTFARIYAKKFGFTPDKILPKLWGDNYFNKKANKWQKVSTVEGSNEELSRCFCELVLKPIKELAESIMFEKKEVYETLLKKFDLDVKREEGQTNKKFLETVFQKWMNASDALLEMMILHLPSPRVAQRYRTQYLYEGQLDDECAKAMIECDPNGPLMIYISKMIPTNDSGKFYAFGRVFSGTVSAGKKVRIMGPNFKENKTDDLFEKTIQRTVVWMGKKAEEIGCIPCGNTCGLGGLDQCIMKQGTISDHPKASIIKCMKYSVSPVVRVAVKPKNLNDMDKFVSGLQKMCTADPIVQVIKTETEHIVAGCGDLHIEICLKDLVEEYSGKDKIEIIKSDPIVPYKETVTSISTQVCMAKSQNKHNKFFMTAEPLNEELVTEIEEEKIKITDDHKELTRNLVENYDWDAHDAKKIWCFGPENTGANMVVDQTKQVQYLTKIRDLMENAFQWSSKEGVLAQECMRGIRFNLLEAEIHPDSVHRGGGQVIPTARRLYHSAQMTAQPRFQEPVYLVTINCPDEVINKIHGSFSIKRGVIFEEESIAGTPQVIIKGYLPVSESFGFSEFLRGQTSGKAFSQCTFSHWDIINSDPFDKKGKAFNITMDIRKRKGLKRELPILSDYVDKA